LLGPQGAAEAFTHSTEPAEHISIMQVFRSIIVLGAASQAFASTAWLSCDYAALDSRGESTLALSRALLACGGFPSAFEDGSLDERLVNVLGVPSNHLILVDLPAGSRSQIPEQHEMTAVSLVDQNPERTFSTLSFNIAKALSLLKHAVPPSYQTEDADVVDIGEKLGWAKRVSASSLLDAELASRLQRVQAVDEATLAAGKLRIRASPNVLAEFREDQAADAQWLRDIQSAFTEIDARDLAPSIWTVHSLTMLADEYGQDSAKLHVATSILLEILLKSGAPPSSGLVFIETGLAASPRRFLLDDTSTTTNVTSNVTLVEIVTFQINLWTSVGLVLILLSAICCMINMDIQPDSLLYAKFQADVSSKME